jgi:transposase-like protein
VPSNLPIDGHSFRRVEVLTGTPRRRRWSAAEKAAIVAESQAPGAQTSEIALRYGLHRFLAATRALGKLHGDRMASALPSPSGLLPDRR